MKNLISINCIIMVFALSSCRTVIIPDNVVDEQLKHYLITEGKDGGKVVLSEKVSLRSAKEMAMKRSPDLEAAEQRIIRAKAVIEQAKAQYFPTLTATVGARHMHHVPQSQFPFTIDPYESYKTALSTQWLIFDGFAREYRLLSAKYGELAAKENFKESQRLLLDAVSQAFYQAILAQKEMEVNQELMAINKQFLADSELKFKAGAGNKTEVNNFKMNLNDAEIAYLEAKSNFTISKLVFVELLGFPEANCERLEFVYSVEKISVPDEQAALDTAFKKRADLKVLQAEILANEAQINEIKGEYQPKFYLEGSYGANSINEFAVENNWRESYVGAAMSWDIFTGNSTAAKIAQKLAEKDEKLKLLKGNWWLMISQIKQQRSSLLIIIEKKQIQERTVELARENYEDVKVIYQTGSTTITRVNEVLSSYAVAKLNLALFEIEGMRRRERLSTLMGTNDH